VSGVYPINGEFRPHMEGFSLRRWLPSDYWAGYMDGAVRSGERAAAEVLDRL
jgi:hypothetical protein